jgi:hypothetical protein
VSVTGEVTGVLGWLGKAWAWWQEYRDPARKQAKRLIAAFEAHGVARQQIARLLPATSAVPTAAFSTPEKLKEELSPALLDWAADLLALQRGWLDLVEDHPHAVVRGYKSMAVYRDWLVARQQLAAHDQTLTIWKTEPGELDPNSEGRLCAVYEETFAGLDGNGLSRYWRFSEEWWLDHAPCIENMVALVALAQSQKILVLGRVASDKVLAQVEAGQLLLPELAKYRQGGWHPDDLVTPLPGKDTPWRQAVWAGAQRYLCRNKNISLD